jgi:predicted Zn-dependent peptidase
MMNFFQLWEAVQQNRVVQPPGPQVQQAQRTRLQQMQQILMWPTPHLPPAPPGFDPKLMELSSDAAQKRVANGLLQQGVDGRQAVLAGQKVADYVWHYSAYPYNVYKRTIALLSDKGVDLQQALAQAKKNQEQAKPIHQRLMMTQYKAA